ncbi:amidohydrolase family protein [Methanobrevibacter olleyae]|uniref:Amidohydrolase n=1 Tax=Methanobrevibacter olleyae TaxID=294671 RepID=A0A126QYC0_METOL|nr:amidohydrolase family protein [Methanobrevibacter olleyae]AMK14828.1 amidohydrolase [Methanobrevibacter olleyae]SFL35340.1 hypothetical protein SAMN02910297_00659 [Methanobrevibacter olleyae]
MQKVINSHCHIYPQKIVARAVEGIGDFYNLPMSLNGTVDDLIKDGSKVGVVHYLVHSVATTHKQVKSINEFIGDEIKAHPDIFTGFGTLHPDSEDIEGDLDYLIELGLKGVKVHPDFQRFALNEERAFKMGEAISERELPIMVHCGDFRYNYSNPKQLKPFLDEFPDLLVIGAHFAGWSVWEEARKKLAGTPNLIVDLSSSLYALSPEAAKDLIHAYGVDKVLWATDFPMWESESEMEMFNKIDLSDEERNLILYKNASKLLGLKE